MKSAQDAFFRAVGITIVRQDAIELVVRRAGILERFLARPGVSYVEAERLQLDGIYRDDILYEFSPWPVRTHDNKGAPLEGL